MGTTTNADGLAPPKEYGEQARPLNTTDIDAPYFVDVFEVVGGTRHDYAMHGSVLFHAGG